MTTWLDEDTICRALGLLNTAANSAFKSDSLPSRHPAARYQEARDVGVRTLQTGKLVNHVQCPSH